MKSKEDLYPLRFIPIYKKALWGGRRFMSVFGRSVPENDEPIAESWEITDHPLGESVIANGSLAGVTLGELVRNRPRDIFGKGNYNPLASPSRFPLILKYLDARLPLSVQVHPDDETAKHLGCTDIGKTEAWVIVDAEPESELWVGTNRRYSRLELERAIRQNRIEKCLRRVRARPGDCYYLKPGTLHALGAGILVAEIQTRSDLTFRVYDWNRPDKDGNRRDLHIDKALVSFRDDNGPIGPIGPIEPQATKRPEDPRVEPLVSDPRFRLCRRRIAKSFHWALDGRCHLVTVLEGSLEFSSPGHGSPEKTLKLVPVRQSGGGREFREKLRRGDSLLLPASLLHVFVRVASPGDAVLLDVTVGALPMETAMEAVRRKAA